MLHRLAFTGVFCAPLARCSGVFCTRFGLAFPSRAFFATHSKLEELSDDLEDLSRLDLYNLQSLFTAGAAPGRPEPRSRSTFRKSRSCRQGKATSRQVCGIGCAVWPLEWCRGRGQHITATA
jgi:hypothetical protein